MKQLDRPEILVALERAVSAHGESSLDPRVPSALWRQALCGPAAEFLARPGKNLRGAIVRAGWTLGGGAPNVTPRGVATVLELLHAGSLIVDDVEDDSHERRGGPTLHRLVGVPLAINTGSWLYFLALAELAALELPGAVDLAVRVLVRCHQGQALDLATRIVDVERAAAPGVVATITRWKTGVLCGLAGELGAIAAGADVARRAAIMRFAEHAGTALQMLDDLGSLATRLDKGREDLRLARATWPWAWLAEHAPLAWADAVEIGREVASGQGDADALAAVLIDQIGAIGRAQIRATLERAIAELAVLRSPELVAAVVADLERMERSYG